MRKLKSRKPRVRSSVPTASAAPAEDGKRLYRVVVEKVLVQSVLIGAVSQDDAESKAYEMTVKVPRGSLLWREEEAQVRDCTSVQLADGSWEFCNALKEK